MRIAVAKPSAIRYACIKFHYAKCVPSVSVGFNVYNDADEWCGVICYGFGANCHIAEPYDKCAGQVIELVRVALNGKQGHGKTSQALAMTLKELPKYMPNIDIVVSYADVDQEHLGILYQSTNWIYTGLMNDDTRGAFIIFGKKMHPKSVYSKGWKQNVSWLKENIDPNAEIFITKGKHKYVYPLDKRTRKKLLSLSQPYPK
jgi:hypothetical protein